MDEILKGQGLLVFYNHQGKRVISVQGYPCGVFSVRLAKHSLRVYVICITVCVGCVWAGVDPSNKRKDDICEIVHSVLQIAPPHLHSLASVCRVCERWALLSSSVTSWHEPAGQIEQAGRASASIGALGAVNGLLLVRCALVHFSRVYSVYGVCVYGHWLLRRPSTQTPRGGQVRRSCDTCALCLSLSCVAISILFLVSPPPFHLLSQSRLLVGQERNQKEIF